MVPCFSFAYSYCLFVLNCWLVKVRDCLCWLLALIFVCDYCWALWLFVCFWLESLVILIAGDCGCELLLCLLVLTLCCCFIVCLFLVGLFVYCFVFWLLGCLFKCGNSVAYFLMLCISVCWLFVILVNLILCYSICVVVCLLLFGYLCCIVLVSWCLVWFECLVVFCYLFVACLVVLLFELLNYIVFNSVDLCYLYWILC